MLDKLISFVRRKVLRIGRYRWDHQYATGRWDAIRANEMERLYTAADFLSRYASGGNVLEIGCGEGIFFENTQVAGYRFYEGIDVSELAISRIPETGNSLFRSADMETYIPVHHPFSVIVLNEVLYYSKKPQRLLKRYAKYLAKDGIFLIGMNDTGTGAAIWRSISEDFTEVDSVKVQQGPMAWYCKTFRVQ